MECNGDLWFHHLHCETLGADVWIDVDDGLAESSLTKWVHKYVDFCLFIRMHEQGEMWWFLQMGTGHPACANEMT